MRVSRTAAGLALALTVALLALPLLPLLQHITPDVAGLLLLANAPLAATGEVKTLLDGILKGFEDFKKTNDERLARMEKGAATSDFEAKLAAMQTDLGKALDLKKDMDRLEAKSNLAGLVGKGADTNPDKVAYKTAFFDRFVRKGEDSTDLRGLQQKAWNITTGSDGGFAVPEQLDRAIEKLIRDISPVRAVANVVTVGTSDYKKLVNRNGIASGWVGEVAARPETNTSAFSEIAPPMGELYANPMVSQQALDDMFFNVEADLQGQLVEEFAVREGSSFIIGTGTNQPRGFLTGLTAATPDATRAFGTIEHIPTGVAGDWAASNPADLLFRVVGALKAGYRNGSVWMMNKTVMFEILRFKDTTGQYLWQPSLQDSGLSIRLLGFPVAEAEDMPAKAANSLSVAFGNFRRGYTIVDRMGMRMLRDPYTNKPYVGFYTTKRVGGAVVNSETIKVLRFATA